MTDCKTIAMDISIALGYDGDLGSPMVKHALARYDCWIKAEVSHDEAMTRAIESGKHAVKALEITANINALVKGINDKCEEVKNGK